MNAIVNGHSPYHGLGTLATHLCTNCKREPFFIGISLFEPAESLSL